MASGVWRGGDAGHSSGRKTAPEQGGSFGWRVGEWQAGCGAAGTPATAGNTIDAFNPIKVNVVSLR